MLEICDIIEVFEKDLKDVYVDDKRIISCGRDESVYYRDLETGHVFILGPFGGSVNSVTVDEDSIFCGIQKGAIFVYGFDGHSKGGLIGHTNNVCTLDIRNGIVASGSWDHTLKLWDKESKNCIESIEHPATVWCARFISDNEIITACADKIIRLYKDSNLVLTINFHNFCVRSLVCIGRNVYSIDNEGALLCSSLQTGELLGHLSFKDLMYSIGTYGENLVCCGENGKIFVISPSLRLLYGIKAPCVSCWRIFTHRKHVYVCGSDGNLYIYGSGRNPEFNPDIKQKYDALLEMSDASTTKDEIFENEHGSFKVKDGNVYQFIDNAWVLIGENKGQKTFDHTFTVELNGRNYKLSFNDNDNVYSVAEAFLLRNHLSNEYKDQIIEFIQNNFSPKSRYRTYHGINIEGVSKHLVNYNLRYILDNLTTPKKQDNKQIEEELIFIYNNGSRFVSLDLYRFFIVNGFFFDLGFLFKFVANDRKEAIAFVRLLTVLLIDPPFNMESLHRVVTSLRDVGLLSEKDLDDYYHNRALRAK